MTIKFMLNGKHVAYINKELLENYREVMGIPEKRKNSQILKDVLYKGILADEYYTDEVDEKIEEAQEISGHLRYNNIGELMEYIMHESMNKKADICRNCNKYKMGVCYLHDVPVSKYSVGCDSLFGGEKPENNEFLEEVKNSISKKRGERS